ncbi:MAG TPA: VOC family protein, partial [Bacillales bacterium]|nr:VOC family protein [Bacillales bacterium]
QMLGFEVTGSWPPDHPNYIHFDMEAGARFSIMEDDDAPSLGRFNFSVSNVDALWEKMSTKAEIVEPLFDTPYGSRKFTIKDLDGKELGFVQE